VATAAYRITQEALTNVARHADATRVNVALSAEKNIFILSVTDDGRGFNLKELTESEGLGVAGMRERASIVGGTLEVQSQALKGTRVYFRVAIQETNAY
jgi:signal transduction histidine kinase